jgi:uncharacterized membrane protein YidH (DUF202 family)
MALERTLLAFIRTALALLLSGATGFYITESPWVHAAAAILIILGLATFITGLSRYRRRKKTLAESAAAADEDEE